MYKARCEHGFVISLRVLQTVSLFVSNFIQTNYSTIQPDFYRLLPFLCQFTGQESKDLYVGQACLKVCGFLIKVRTVLLSLTFL